ncbi:hypothetical protein CK203_081487 [Vitis vinifera]|uniref:Uncharacterized protein n=1 Tax=Vitis vinifera TaxID=29760 RepID=A0A438DYE7_VITVI|nr:hypothetical protein CK203_081487 [Vitis vinifera]
MIKSHFHRDVQICLCLVTSHPVTYWLMLCLCLVINKSVSNNYVLTEGKVHDFQVEKNFLNGKLKAVTAYFSDTSIQKNISSFQ